MKPWKIVFMCVCACAGGRGGYRVNTRLSKQVITNVHTYILIHTTYTLKLACSKGPYKEGACSSGAQGHSESNAGVSECSRHRSQKCRKLTLQSLKRLSVGCCLGANGYSSCV